MLPMWKTQHKWQIIRNTKNFAGSLNTRVTSEDEECFSTAAVASSFPEVPGHFPFLLSSCYLPVQTVFFSFPFRVWQLVTDTVFLHLKILFSPSFSEGFLLVWDSWFFQVLRKIVSPSYCLAGFWGEILCAPIVCPSEQMQFLSWVLSEIYLC